jgi:PKD repeat protein
VSFDYAEDYAFPVGRTEVTATASLGGVSTSCTFRVIVTDEEAPTLTCPGNLTVSLDPCGTYQLDPEGLGITATDNCGAATVRVDRTDFDAPGTYPIDVTATDAAGNERSCAFTLTLEESDDPYTIDMTDDNLGTVCSEEEVIIRPADLLANDKLIVAGELEVLSVSVGATADGTVTANDDGTYTFVSAPDYTDYITLTYEVGVVEGSGPCTIAPSSGTIYLDVVDVVADFTFEPSSTEPGELIYGFDDISEPEATAWRYTVNGTQIGTATYAQYRFSAPGTYTVCLRVTTDCGQEEVCKDITVGGAPGPDCDAVDFGGGWNFISFDVRPPGQGLVSQVVAGSSEAGSLFLIQRRTEDGRIETYLPNYPEYGTDFPLTPGAAYRMYAFGGGTLEVCGRAVDEDIRIGIEPGYNWVGYVPQESRPAADYFGDIPGLYFARERRGSLTDFAVRYYLPNYSYFSRLSVVENGVGYEVYSFGAAEPGGWRPAGGGLSEVHTTFAGDVSGLQAGDTIAITDANGKHYAYWQVEAGGRLRAMTIFGHDTLSGAFAELPPGRELYFRWGDRQANESVTFGGEGGLEWVDLHFPNVANSLPPTEAELRTHPNPFRDRITATLRLPEAHQGAHLQLYDLNGRLLREQNLPPAAAEATYSVEWPAGDLASGTYFLRCVVGERTVVTRRVQKFR